MSREIRFRAWSKDDKLMFNVFGFDPNHVYAWQIEGTEYPVIPPDREDTVLMQFTGLHDMHGTEIYEGDVVMSGRGSYAISWDKDQGCWTTKPDIGGAYPALNPGTRKSLTVIGNIYENPERLEAQE